MKRIIALIIVSITLTVSYIRANEGMWLLTLINELNIKDMNAMGCRLSAEDIYSINKSSLKDAVVIFGSGCTGEMVSNQGLLFTNHHCGYESIQQLSSIEHDFLTQGFWAKNKSEELQVPGLSVTFLIRMEDVTNKILPELSDGMKEPERDTIIAQISRKLQSEAVQGTHYEAKVEEYFEGTTFYLLVYERFTDVRLVGTPPSSIGKFGGDTDNWMWPRHTGDFSVFRVYSGTDGKPAKYSATNIPLKPKRYLQVSTKGIAKDDFTMILGYPGNTNRYMTSYGVKEILDVQNPDRVKIRGARQEILTKDMNADPVVRIKYADKYSKSSNYWKYSIGQNKGLVTLDVVQKKEDEENKFRQWVNANPDRKKKYGKALPLIKDAIESRKYYQQAMQYINEAFLESTEVLSLPLASLELYGILKAEPDSIRKIKIITEGLRTKMRAFYKDYNISTDKKVAAVMFKLYYDNVNEGLRPSFLNYIHGKKYKGNYEKYVDHLYKETFFDDSIKLKKFLENPSFKTLEKDEAFGVAISIAQTYFGMIDIVRGMENDLNRGNRLYCQGIREMDTTKAYYPDANFTMRMTYGKVGDYDPRDAVHYNYFTTLKGIMEKEDTASTEFQVPLKLKALYKAKDYDIYAQNGVMPVCFTTNNDITGGNSGSPVMNANGDLIGLAFDGNWEAMSGDIIYEPVLQKTICVDIRYVLFIMDKFAGAKYLVNEMTLKQ
jgi:hypothetical protein